MGNHEFCTDCGASDFHYGKTCQQAYPDGYKKTQKENARKDRRDALGLKAVPQVVRMLKKLGLPAHQSCEGHIQIYSFDLAEWEGKKLIKALR